jgi:hypothetical protein
MPGIVAQAIPRYSPHCFKGLIPGAAAAFNKMVNGRRGSVVFPLWICSPDRMPAGLGRHPVFVRRRCRI